MKIYEKIKASKKLEKNCLKIPRKFTNEKHFPSSVIMGRKLALHGTLSFCHLQLFVYSVMRDEIKPKIPN